MSELSDPLLTCSGCPSSNIHSVIKIQLEFMMESATNRELSRSSWQRFGRVEITEENVESCYTNAVLQNESNYAKVCIKSICENLRVDNCIRFLKSANETIRDEEFLARVRDFVLKNIEEVKSRPEFMHLAAGTIDTLLVPITTLRKDSNEQQLDYSPSELFPSIYEWMSDNRPQRMLKFGEILDEFPLESVDVDVLEKVYSDEELQGYPRIGRKLFDALMKKYRKDIQPHNRKMTLEAEMQEEMDQDCAPYQLEPKEVEVALTSAASDNERDVSKLQSLLVSQATEPVLSVDVGSTRSGLGIPSDPEKDDDVIFVDEIQRDHSEDRLGVKMEPKEVEAASTSVASDNEEDVMEQEASFSEVTEPSPSVAGSTASFEIPSTPECDDFDDVIVNPTVNPYLPSDWLSETMPKVHPYFPQIGDDLVYLRQGHKRYMQEVSKTRAYPTTSDTTASLPYKRDPNLPSEVSVKLTNIAFKNFPPRVAILTLERTGWDSGEPTGDSFLVYYHILPNGSDFLVLRQVYDYALKRQWKTGDRFRSLRTGRPGSIIQANEPFQSSSFPNSHYLSFFVAWDDQSEELLSPWELDRIGGDPEILPRKSEGQDKESKRISSLLDFLLLKIPSVALLLSLHAPEFDAGMDYPMNLGIIKARLDNLFYRNSEAILTDSDQLALNAAKSSFRLGGDGGDSTKLAKVFTRLIREIVSDVSMTQESLENRFTELCHPGPGDGNTSGARREGSGNENSSTLVENSTVVAVGAAHSSKPFNIDSRRVVGTPKVQLSLVSEFDKSIITNKSLSTRSRSSHLQGANKKQVLKKKASISSKPKSYHECTYCDYSSAIKSFVKDHEYTHTGEKPYSCPDCLRSFFCRRSIYRHRVSCKGTK